MQCIFPCKGGMYLLIPSFASIGYLHGEAGLRELSFEFEIFCSLQFVIMVFPDHTRLIFLMSAVGSVKQYLSEKESDKALSCGSYHNLPLSHRAVGWSAVCDCSRSCSYSLFN